MKPSKNHQYIHLDEDGEISLLSYFIHAENFGRYTRTVNQAERQWIYQGQHITQSAGNYTLFTHDMNTGNLLYSAETQTELLAMFAIDSGVPLAVNQPANTRSLKVFPVPADNYLTFSSLLQDVRVMDLAGRTILSSQEMRSSLDVSILPSGCYMLHGQNHQGLQTARFIKR